MTIEVEIDHRLGAFHLSAQFASAGRVTALFGPSGAGKSSVVAVLAGLLRPERARVVVDGTVLVDTQARIFVPRHRRRMGCVFQDSRLFPHLDVRRNLLFGRFFAGRAGPAGPAIHFDAVVDLLGIAHLLDRRPAGLSGGETSRVAIGRALLSRPRLLLMDEPLAALDEARRSELLPYLVRLRDEAGVPIVYVSHAAAEVAQLASTLVLMRGGSVVGYGPAAEMLPSLDPPGAQSPSATLIAANVAGHDSADGLTRLSTGAGSLAVPTLDVPVGTSLHVRIAARDVLVATERPAGIASLNIVEGRILALEPAGEGRSLVAISCGPVTLDADLARRAVRDLGLEPGRAVFAIVTHLHVER